ncbi:MAG: FlgD immunoglobulin-like domain containing protein [Candidatus Cloacimonadaceae bacterium]|jgi:hypothetical protein|nr:FlgD immunoglobulin-like domain containing protein [Candidatus Cloacimonadaceae bacterium]
MRNTLKTMLTLCLFMTVFTASWAIAIQVGTGTATSDVLPINTNADYSYSQQIYTQAQINQAGWIKSISFHFDSGGNTNSDDWDVYLGHTSKTSFSGVADWIPVGDLTLVYGGTVTISTGYFATLITFTTPFYYNNTDNLVIAIDENAPGNAGSNGSFRRFSSGDYTGLYRNYTSNIDPKSPGTGTRRTGNLSQIRFDIEIDNPTDVTAIPYSETQIDLSWTRNSTPDKVMVAWSSTNDFGTPVYGTNYSAGDTITDGGTVIYKGSDTSFSHTSLSENTTYYYKLWSVKSDGLYNVAYSPGVTTSARTLAQTLPVELSSFTAALYSFNHVKLQWVTQSETNVSGFRIYRNTEDLLETAEMLDLFIPATNTSQMKVYIATDKEIFEEGIYYFWLENVDLNGESDFHGPIHINITFADAPTPEVPLVQGINNAYPNPFNPTVNITCGMVKGGQASVQVYNTRGQLVKTLFTGTKEKGTFKLQWNGTDQYDRKMPSGIYLIRMDSNGKNPCVK